MDKHLGLIPQLKLSGIVPVKSKVLQWCSPVESLVGSVSALIGADLSLSGCAQREPKLAVHLYTEQHKAKVLISVKLHHAAPLPSVVAPVLSEVRYRYSGARHHRAQGSVTSH